MTLTYWQLGVLVFGWIAYFLIHSLLASLWLKERVYCRYPGLRRYYRVLYNGFAVVALFPLFALLYLWRTSPLWDWPGGWFWLANGIAVIALASILILPLTACGGGNSASGDPLDGTSWELMAYRKTRPIPGTTITAIFEDGQVSGSAGCNSYSGSYQVSGDAITVGPTAITEMACLEPEGAMEQEMTFMDLLTNAQTFQLTDEQLQIFRADGEALTFVSQN